jgi:hypothetical protein
LATIALRKSIPFEVICENMGHENETTTHINLSSLSLSIVEKVNEEIVKLGLLPLTKRWWY